MTQRGCGQSKDIFENYSHKSNIKDLDYIVRENNINCIIGHSYGAKLLSDYCTNINNKIKSIFIGISDSMVTPRINNILYDLVFLKKENSIEYQEIYESLDDFSLDKIWEVSEKVAHLFSSNSTRPFYYWANLKAKESAENIQKDIGFKINPKVFSQVRKDIYELSKISDNDISKISNPKIWINGMHDLVMRGYDLLTKNRENEIVFTKSAHHPHIEEPDKMESIINEFI